MSVATLQSLGSQLRSARIPNFEDPPKEFIPDEDLFSIINGIDIDSCLHEAKITLKTLRLETKKAIQNNGQKLFAILAMMNDHPVHLLENFLKFDQLNPGNINSRLPFDLNRLADILGSTPLAAEFFDLQWSVISPLFQEDRSERNFTKNTVLPFVQREELGKGSYGAVYKITFSKSHHDFKFQGGSRNVQLACKEMHPEHASEIFANEKWILLMLRQIRHDNMVQLLTSYTIPAEHGGHKLCLMFPLADSSLDKFLKDDSKDAVRDYFNSNEELFQQIYGLSSALESLHSYVDAAEGVRMKGAHFDLAPRNILIDNGRLLLADFGLSRLRNEPSDSGTSFKGGMGDFLAPECIVPGHSTNYRHGRKSDIWSLGGILTVLIVFMKLGKAGVEEFRSARSHVGKNRGTVYRFHADGSVNGGMIDWLTSIKNFSFEHDCAIKIARKMLSLDPHERPSAGQITADLYLLAQRARCRHIDQQFEALLARESSMQLDIEQNRFLIWSAIAGLMIESHDEPESKIQDRSDAVHWLARSKESFTMVTDLLRAIEKENEFLITGLKPNDPVSPVFNRLRELNNNLWSVPPLEQRQAMLSMLESSMDRMFDNYMQTTEFKKFSPSNGPSWEKQAKLIAAMRFLSRRVAANESLEEPRTRVIAQNLVKIKKTLKESAIVLVEGNPRPALCEWLSYEVQVIDKVAERLFNRVELIARNFSKEPSLEEPFLEDMRTLSCRGFFHDISQARFGLLFDYPSSASAEAVPTPLRDLLKRRSRPSLECLFDLAKTLVRNIHLFHRAEWFHKNISSHNVVFFDESLDLKRPKDASNSSEKDTCVLPPSYLIGFNHSRPSDPLTFTSGGSDISKMYQHPQYAGNPKQRFKLGYDYYSLGLLLLEIGLWEPISRSKLLGKKNIEDFKPSELARLWKDKAVPLLGTLMGTIYHNAVLFCLNDELLNWSEYQAKKEFGHRVVEALARCCV